MWLRSTSVPLPEANTSPAHCRLAVGLYADNYNKSIMTDINTLLATEEILHRQQLVRDLHGIRVDDGADFQAVYQTWLRGRPKAYQRARLMVTSKQLCYPCRVVFSARISVNGTRTRIEVQVTDAPV